MRSFLYINFFGNPLRHRARVLSIVIIAIIKMRPSLATWPASIAPREKLLRLNRSKCFPPSASHAIAITDVLISPAANLFLIPTDRPPRTLAGRPRVRHYDAFPRQIRREQTSPRRPVANETVIAETPRPRATLSSLEPFVYLSRFARGENTRVTRPPFLPRGKGCRAEVSTNALRKRAGYYTDPT